MVRLLLGSSLRYFLRHPAQLALSILGIVLGVALVSAVLVTNASSRAAFRQSAEALTGNTTHQIFGGTAGIAESDYVQLQRTRDLSAAPVMIGYIELRGELFTVLGRDFVADISNGLAKHLALPSVLPGSFESSSPTLLLSAYTQARLQLPLHKPLAVLVNGRLSSITIAATFGATNPAATEGILIGDMASVQTLFRRFGFIDQIDLSLTADQADKLSRELPDHLQLRPASRQIDLMNQMTRGFQINLTAMSLLALLIGAFLIHNSTTFSVLQRRRTFAIQRLCGATTRQLFVLIIAEISVVSLVASLFGVAAGYALAHYLIQLTTRTVNDLYFVLHIEQVWLDTRQFVLLVLLGVSTSIIAATASAFEAASVSPLQANLRSRLESRVRGWLALVAGIGLALLVTGLILAVTPSRSLLPGFAAMMLFILGYGLATPWAVNHLAGLLESGAHKLHPVIVMVTGSIRQNISRTGLAIAALTIALAATLAVDIMIGSFRHSVNQWLSTTLQSDIYITLPATARATTQNTVNIDLINAVHALPFVDDVSSARSIHVEATGGRIEILALEPHQRSKRGFQMLQGDINEVWPAFLQGQGLLITEPLANRLGLGPGDNLSLFTDQRGFRPFSILGVYRDYGSSYGRLTLSMMLYRQHWQDQGISSIGINLRDPADMSTALSALRSRLQQEQVQWLIRANQDIRERSLAVFDRTFQVTRVLRLLVVAVAFIGVFSALLALQLEKSREYAVLRALGMTPAQNAGLVMGQTLLMGLLAGLLALPSGWIMSEILIQVINLRSFGWSMGRWLPTRAIPETLMLAVSSAALAGIYPMWAMSRRTIANQLRDE